MRFSPLFILLFIALAAYGQQTSVAVLPSDASEEAKMSQDELDLLTENMREAALKVLPSNAFIVLDQNVVIKRLGGFENYVKECMESSCIVRLGKKVQVDYVSQARVRKLEGKFYLSVNLYNVKTEGAVAVPNYDGVERPAELLALVKKNVPAEVFGKIPEVSGGSKPAQQSSNNFLDRGILFASRGDYEIAFADFTEALKQQPNNGNIYTLRGRVYVANASKVTSSAADFSEITVSAYDTLTPKQSKDYDQAINDFTNAIKLEPKKAVNYYERGRVYKLKKNYDKAIADYSQAIRLDPNYVSAYRNRGYAYHDKGNYDEAIADYNQAIRLKPDYASYSNRGVAYYLKEDYDKAIADYIQAIKLKPDFEKAKQNLEEARRMKQNGK